MQFRAKHSPLLLLLLPSIANALATNPATDAVANSERDSIPAADVGDVAVLKGRLGVPTKDAPVDGKDGKPHLGPFVETDGTASTDTKGEKDLPALKGRPKDPTMVDGKKIPESNDGVMFDKNREKPQDGTTGTEGGVSEKDKARKAHEGKTGEKLVNQPEAPKEHPPIPHSEEKKIEKGKEKTKGGDADKEKPKSTSDKDGEDTGYTGLEVRLQFCLFSISLLLPFSLSLPSLSTHLRVVMKESPFFGMLRWNGNFMFRYANARNDG